MNIQRPATYWEVVGQHVPLAAVSGSVLLASSLIPVGTDLPVFCGFLRWTGYPCPFCGMTRSFELMGHGMPLEAVHMSPAGAIFYVLTAAVFIWNIAGLLTGRVIQPETGLFATSVRRKAWFWGSIVLLSGSWIYRLAVGLK